MYKSITREQIIKIIPEVIKNHKRILAECLKQNQESLKKI